MAKKSTSKRKSGTKEVTANELRGLSKSLRYVASQLQGAADEMDRESVQTIRLHWLSTKNTYEPKITKLGEKALLSAKRQVMTKKNGGITDEEYEAARVEKRKKRLENDAKLRKPK